MTHLGAKSSFQFDRFSHSYNYINRFQINNKTARIRAKPWMFRLPFEVS